MLDVAQNIGKYEVCVNDNLTENGSVSSNQTQQSIITVRYQTVIKFDDFVVGTPVYMTSKCSSMK